MEDRKEMTAAEHPENGSAKVTRLRDEIDRGGAADKVAFSDPAAAPLGTDAEAAGAPPTAEEAAMAQRREAHRAPAAEQKRDPTFLQCRDGPGLSPGVWLVIAAAAALVLLAVLFL